MLKIKKIKPLFNKIVVTANKYEEVKVGNLIDTAKSDTIKEYQEVLAIGGAVRDIKVGDIVLINPARYAVKKHKEGSLKDGVITDNPITQYNFNMVEIDDKQCILLHDADIDYIIEDSVEVPDPQPTKIITPSTKIIV